MSTLISILRAVHCRSTHHFFAIDALDRIDTPNGRRLASVLLANYQEYLNGAKDPDTKFKDFQNHVIHVSDNNWGGAPKACETWLARVIADIHNSDWKAAAYSIGVLSHYFTDPFMPLHTASILRKRLSIAPSNGQFANPTIGYTVAAPIRSHFHWRLALDG